MTCRDSACRRSACRSRLTLYNETKAGENRERRQGPNLTRSTTCCLTEKEMGCLPPQVISAASRRTRTVKPQLSPPKARQSSAGYHLQMPKSASTFVSRTAFSQFGNIFMYLSEAEELEPLTPTLPVSHSKPSRAARCRSLAQRQGGSRLLHSR